MGKINLYIVRHGQTSFNLYGRIQGWADSPLTSEGVKLACDLNKRMKDIEFDAAFSNDSNRARYTRDYVIGDLEVPKYETKLIREIGFGEYEGELVRNIWSKEKGRDPKNTTVFERVDMIKEGEGVETMDVFRKRVDEGLDEIIDTAKTNGYKNILVVSHGVTISTIARSIDSSIDPDEIPLNASVCKVCIDKNDRKLEYYNDTEFYKKGSNQ